MELSKIEEIANSFKIRASAAIEIMGKIGLTEKQQATYDTLTKRALDFKNGVDKVKDLTDNMKRDLSELQSRLNNPELPEGAKTHCKKWLKERLFNRRMEIKSKQVRKGNIQEEAGFTLMALHRINGMVYKNTQLYQNEYLIGTPDIVVKPIVYDNKCSYSLDTFPMFETEVPDEKYEWQLNVYAELTGCEAGELDYTLVDADILEIERELKWIIDPNERYKIATNLIFTQELFDHVQAEHFPDATYTYFKPIPEEERIVHFSITKDPAKIAALYERVPMCRQYIKSLLIKKYHGK